MRHYPENHIQTTYPSGTPAKLIALLEALHGRDRRVRIWLGDPKTGETWDEEHDVMGYIGRSSGPDKVPLMVFSRASLGGSALLVKNVLRVDDTKTGETLYKSPNLQPIVYTVEPLGEAKNAYGVYRVTQATQNEVQLELTARFNTLGKAVKWSQFMEGKRYRKW